MARKPHPVLTRIADRSGAAALELALVFPLLTMLIFGIWYLGWNIYCGGEVRHAVELGSRIYISNPSATTGDLQTAVAAHLQDLSISNFSLATSQQAVGTATNQHITWSYNTTLSVPFVPSLPMNFSGAIDVPLATQ